MLTAAASGFYTIILTVAMVTSPDGGRTFPVEKDVRVTVELPETQTEYILPQTCQRLGMLEAVKYTKEHPFWKVTRWRCPPPGKEKIDS